MNNDHPGDLLSAGVCRGAREAGRRAAVRVGDRALSYAQLDRDASRVAAAFARQGVRAGDVVAVLAPTSLVYVTLIVAAARCGVVIAPLPMLAGEAALAGMFADARARLVFTERPGDLPTGQAAAVVELGGDHFARWMGSETLDEAVVVPETDPATIIYSSGTTGTPKGIVQPQAYRASVIRNASLRGYDQDTVSLLATPLYSNTTLSSLAQTLGTGGTLVLMPKFDAGEWLRLAAATKVTNATLVPVMIQRLMAHPAFAATELSSMRAKVCLAAPFPAGAKREALERFPGRLIEIYGLTETGTLTILNADDFPDKLHTVGQVIPGAEVRLIDDEDNEVPSGELGEIVARSPALMVEYHNRPAETLACRWTAPDGSVWMRTGDVGRFDEDGFLILGDRKKDMIISGGFNIYPSEIEEILLGHPAVADAAVIGVASQTWGETPVAFVVTDGLSADEIRQWANARVNKMQRLADVVAVEELPRGPVGKVLKKVLRERYGANRTSIC